MVADVADQEQRPPGQHQLGPAGGGVGAVAVHAPGDRLSALGEPRLQLAGHQAEPAAVGADLVRAVDGGDGVLQVDDRGDRRLQQHVRDPGVVLATDPAAGVDTDLQVQAVAAQEHGIGRRGIAAVPRELPGVGQTDDPRPGLGGQRPALDAVGRDVRVARPGERDVLVEQPVGLRDHLGTAPLVVPRCEVVVRRQRVRAVQGVEQRPPARVRRVQRVPRHRRGHHELRTRHLRDLPVDARRRDPRLLRRQQVADLLEERDVAVELVLARGAVLAVPGVEPPLQLVAARQQLRGPRGEAPVQVGQRGPEPLRRQVQPRQQLLRHERGQSRVDLQAARRLALCHRCVGRSCLGHRSHHPRAVRRGRTFLPSPPDKSRVCAHEPAVTVVRRSQGTGTADVVGHGQRGISETVEVAGCRPDHVAPHLAVLVGAVVFLALHHRDVRRPVVDDGLPRRDGRGHGAELRPALGHGGVVRRRPARLPPRRPQPGPVLRG